MTPPQRRWDGEEYQARFDERAASGVNVHGEADLVMTLAPRTVLDAGCGTGRVARELAARGVEVVGVDADPSMIETARRLAPAVSWHVADLCGLDLGRRFDVVVMAGNVPLFTAPGTQAALVAACARHVGPTGALVCGFQLGAEYPLADYDEHCRQAGLELVQRWSTWEREPFPGDGGYAVSVHREVDPTPRGRPSVTIAAAMVTSTPATADTPLRAVLFDVDGTLVDSERDGHRVAFNRALEEFGLPDRWDVPTYGELLWTTGGERRLHRHLSGRGMPEEERNRLVPLLHARKTEIFCEMAAGGLIAPRPGAARLLDELQAAGIRLAVATTGTRAWVHPLLQRSFGADRFEVIVTGDEAPERKPDPSAYLLALERLGLPASAAVAIEDSANGLEAARAAGLPCVVVVNGYTRDHRLEAADLVLDGFGEPSSPARVLHDPHRLQPAGCLDPITVARLQAAAATIDSGTRAVPD